MVLNEANYDSTLMANPPTRWGPALPQNQRNLYVGILGLDVGKNTKGSNPE